MALDINNIDTEATVIDDTPVGNAPVADDNDNSDKIHGLSDAEMNDPNAIVVNVVDPNVPIVILYGPTSCGKTMTLVRLTRYLAHEGYTVEPVKSFRPSEDRNYKDLCDNFNQMINNNDAADGTGYISFMLVNVLKEGKSICQILEAPGEYYFDKKEANKPYPAYINRIIGSPNRKVWSVMLEPDWEDDGDRRNYVTRIADLKRRVGAKDRFLFIYNKVDKTHFVRRERHVQMNLVKGNIENMYPNMFAPFKNQHPITKLWKDYNCDLVAFMTGYYNKKEDGKLMYTEGPDDFPESLWNKIKSFIRG